MAQEHLQWTVELADYMKRHHAALWQQVMEHCRACEEDVRHMQRIAAKMTLLFDPTQRIYPSDASFVRKKVWPQRKGEWWSPGGAATADDTSSHGGSAERRRGGSGGWASCEHGAVRDGYTSVSCSDVFAREEAAHPPQTMRHGPRDEYTDHDGAVRLLSMNNDIYPVCGSSRSGRPDSLPGLRRIPPTRATSMTATIATNTAHTTPDVDTPTSHVGSDSGGGRLWAVRARRQWRMRISPHHHRRR